MASDCPDCGYRDEANFYDDRWGTTESGDSCQYCCINPANGKHLKDAIRELHGRLMALEGTKGKSNHDLLMESLDNERNR